MTTFEIIPAIDIKDGRCVRLYQGDYDQVTIFDHDPVAVARKWESLGARRIHVVDLDGAKAGRPVNAQIVYAIVRAVQVPIQLGGGLRDQAAIESALGLGVDRVILGTVALRDPLLIERLAQEHDGKIVVGVDARDGWVAVQGWTETSHLKADELVRRVGALGVQHVIYTDIGRDGTLEGPNIDEVAEMVRVGGPSIIASGGIGALDDLTALASTGAEGAIVGRALYTGAFDLPQAIAAIDRLRQGAQRS